MPNPLDDITPISENQRESMEVLSGVDPRTHQLANDSENDTIAKWAKDNGYKLNNDTLDYLYQQFFTEKNNESAWQRTLQADKTKYSRAVQDIKNAGLNPFLAIQGSPSGAGSSSAGSISGGSYAQSLASKRSQQTGISQSVIGALGLAIGALIYALL